MRSNWTPITSNEFDSSELPDRKQFERELFQECYARDGHYDDPRLRERLLRKCEESFCRLIEKYAYQSNVLEIGCGRGLHSRYAAEYGAECVIGIDLAEDAIKIANSLTDQMNLSDRVTFQVADIEALPFETESFDLIINHEAFACIDLPSTIPELARVLKSGGHLISQESLGDNPLFRWNRQRHVKSGKRSQWTVDHTFRAIDLVSVSPYFQVREVQYHHLVSALFAPFAVELPDRLVDSAAKAFDWIDQQLLMVPALSLCAFRVVMDWAKCDIGLE